MPIQTSLSLSCQVLKMVKNVSKENIKSIMLGLGRW